MSISEGLKTTLGIINAAGTLLDSSNPRDAKAIAQRDYVAGKVGTGLAIAKRSEGIGGAITAFSSQTTILSRVFIDETIIDEPIIPNLLRTNHEWYAAQVISALHLSRMVDGQRTVQDVMSVVQTGHNERERGVLGNVAARRMGIESFLTNYTGEVSGEIGLESLAPTETVEDVVRPAAPVDNFQIRSVSASEHRIGPMGELFEVKLTNPNGNGQSVTVPVFIQMQPSLIPAQAAPRFIDMNVMPATWQRWTQMRAGELTFWKDFVFQRDLANRQKSVIKDPKTAAAFSDFLKTVAKKDKYAMGDATDRLGSRYSSNLANSVVIFSEETVAQAKVDSGIDLHNEHDRKRYFRDTYSMIVVIVDPLHQRVTIYFNGLDGDLNVAYGDFRPKDQKFDPKEFMGAIQAFSTNNVGRMR